jgi:hypothetical protein
VAAKPNTPGLISFAAVAGVPACQESVVPEGRFEAVIKFKFAIVDGQILVEVVADNTGAVAPAVHPPIVNTFEHVLEVCAEVTVIVLLPGVPEPL